MVDQVKLDPCPFCGGDAEIERYGTPRQSTIYACSECGCRLETGETWGFNSWNERHEKKNMMTDETLLELATYLTGSRVVRHSVGLQIGGQKKQEADAFFAMRNALGVTGWMTTEEALVEITKAISE